jgi:peptidoglycan/LPS O-acetylase OafA/YrhL
MENGEIARVRGLDTLRAAAIVLVLMYHYLCFVSGESTFGVFSTVGWVGVDLFFVLSGYLIGNQILSPIAKGQPFSLRTFFGRRLLRTLPNYYFVLALYLLFPAVLAGSSTASTWRFLTFTQNFGLGYGQTFTHSWSLCIEEQFYLILPLVAVLLAKYARSAKAGWFVIGGAIAAGMAARAAGSMEHGFNSFSAEIYYSSFCRFDELLPGVAIAMLKNFHGGLYEKLLRRGNLLLCAGLVGIVIVLYSMSGSFADSRAVTTFGFSLIAASFGLITLSALSPCSMLNRLRVPGAASLALWSYALYLIHKPIFMLARDQFKHFGIKPTSVMVVPFVLAVSLAAGWLLYRVVETPFMQLRSRWFPAKPQQAIPVMPVVAIETPT